MRSYYEILEVSETASHEVIRASYRVLAQKYHPDNLQTGDGESFRLLNSAHETLTDSEKRRRYDLSLAQERAAALRQAAEQPMGVNPNAYPPAYPKNPLEEAAMNLGVQLLNHFAAQVMTANPEIRLMYMAMKRRGA